MAMSIMQAEGVLRVFIEKVKGLFFKGGNFEMAGMTVVPRITVGVFKDKEGKVLNVPDGAPTPVGDGLGIEVNQNLLNINDDNAIKFALAHELGHGASLKVLEDCGYAGVSGELTEIVADLCAAHLLANSGVSWQTVLTTVDNWKANGIFSPEKKGDHPVGADRATYVHSLFSLIQDHSFNDAVKAMCMSFKG